MIRDRKLIEQVEVLLNEFDELKTKFEMVTWTRKVKEFLELNKIDIDDIQVVFMDTENINIWGFESSVEEIREFLENLLPKRSGGII